MSRAKPKFYIASKYTNHIAYRKLSAFEDRNPKMFELSNKAFETWEDAHAWVFGNRVDAVKVAKRALASAERQLAKAMTMKNPADSTETSKELEAA